MAVLDVAALKEALAQTQMNPKLTRDNLGNEGFNVRDLTDGEFNLLHAIKLALDIRLQIKRSGTGLRVTFYTDQA